jgi:hypothetical protein
MRLALIASVLLVACVQPSNTCPLTQKQFLELQRAVVDEIRQTGYSSVRFCYPFGDGGQVCAEATIEAADGGCR